MDLRALRGRLASRLPDFRRGAATATTMETAEDLSGVSLVIAPATPADVPAMVDITEAFFNHDPFHQALESEETEPSYFRERRETTSYFIGRLVEMPDSHFLVARDPRTNKVVGFVGLQETPAEAPAAEVGDGGPMAAANVTAAPGKEVTKERVRSTTAMLRRLVRKHMAGRAHLLCSYLFVRPQHIGQGVGGRLLEHVLAQPQLQKVPIAVWPLTARDTFRNHGWREIDSAEVDLAEWSAAAAESGAYRLPLLLREPGAAAGQ